MSSTLKRHNLLFSDEEWKNLVDKSKELRMSVSEFVRKTMNNEIKKQDEIDLIKYIDDNCDYVSVEEEKEIMKILETIDSNDVGVELTVEDILQS